MTALTSAELATVYGGAAGTNQTRDDGIVVDSTTTRTNYGYCVDQVKAQTAAAYPDTRPQLPIIGLPMPLTTDDNATARANATMQNMVAVCGQPPA